MLKFKPVTPKAIPVAKKFGIKNRKTRLRIAQPKKAKLVFK